MTNDRKTTPEHVTSLAEYEVFVFGSNKEGQHWGGAAKFAYDNFGAEWGVGIGMTGQSNVSLPESFWNIIEMTAPAGPE